MALAEAGETDLAYKAIATETYPSYGKPQRVRFGREGRFVV